MDPVGVEKKQAALLGKVPPECVLSSVIHFRIIMAIL
jgi:hypothetical protein